MSGGVGGLRGAIPVTRPDPDHLVAAWKAFAVIWMLPTGQFRQCQ